MDRVELSMAMRGIAKTRPGQAMMNERRAPSSARALQSKRRFLRIKDHHFRFTGVSRAVVFRPISIPNPNVYNFRASRCCNACCLLFVCQFIGPSTSPRPRMSLKHMNAPFKKSFTFVSIAFFFFFIIFSLTLLCIKSLTLGKNLISPLSWQEIRLSYRRLV